MKKLAVLVIAAAAFLVFAAMAQAKEIGSLKVCGENGCNTLADAEQLKGWEPSGGETSTAVAPAQRYYFIELGFTDPEGSGNIIHHERAYWLPDSGLFRFRATTDTSWSGVLANQKVMYEKAAAGIEPFTPTLTKVTVKGRAVADPNSYLKLFDRFRYAVLGRAKLHLVRIKLTPAGENPWLQGTTILSYDAKQRLLIRPDGYFRVPAALGRLVMARASLNSKASVGSGGGGTALYAGIGVGALAAVAVLGVARHKKMT